MMNLNELIEFENLPKTHDEIPKMMATGKRLNEILNCEMFIEDKIYIFSSLGEAVRIAENEEL